jgi:apolipoprotein N-acyltransferase
MKKVLYFFLAILCGLFTALAFPKFSLSYLAWFSLLPLLFVLYESKPSLSFWLSFVAGLAFYGILIYWIPDVPAHYGDVPYFLSLVIFLVLIAYLSLYWGIFGYIFSLTKQASPELACLVAPFLWVALEYGVTHILSGFPWGLIGYTQSPDLPLIQMTSLTGVYGVSFLIIFFESSLLLFIKEKSRNLLISSLVLVALTHSIGFLVLKKAPVASENQFTAAVIQGNVSSDIYWDMLSPEEINRIFSEHIELSRLARDQGAGLIIWPEFSVPLCFSCSEPLYQDFKQKLMTFARENDCTLLLGTNEMAKKDGKELYFNTALSLQPNGSYTSYAKMHLVPFGEYTPYKKIFFFINSVSRAIGEVTPGKEYRLHQYKGQKFASPICYEIIFPSLVRKLVRQGASFLTTITNDGWYGPTSAPHQHFNISIFRAVENRRYLLRAATTGVSGLVDPYGRVIAKTPIMVKTFLVGKVYPVNKSTPYNRFGDILPILGLTISLFSFILALLRRK